MRSNAPSLGASGEPGHPCSILFSREGGGGGGIQREGYIDPYAGISTCANTMGKQYEHNKDNNIKSRAPFY